MSEDEIEKYKWEVEHKGAPDGLPTVQGQYFITRYVIPHILILETFQLKAFFFSIIIFNGIGYRHIIMVTTSMINTK